MAVESPGPTGPSVLGADPEPARDTERRSARRPRRRLSARQSVDGRSRTAPGAGWTRGRVLGGGPAHDVKKVGSPARRMLRRETQSRWDPDHEQLLLLAALLDAGVRVDRAFATLARAARDRRTRGALEQVVTDVREGGRLSDALADVGVPDHVVGPLVGAERAGRTADGLRGAADFVRRLALLRATLRRALVYPAFVLVVGLLIVAIITITVVPPLERTFDQLGGELPTATLVVLSASRWLRDPWVLAALLGAAGCARILLRTLPLHASAALKEHVPIVGRLTRDLQVAVFARSAATMLSVGVPLVEVLRIGASAAPPGHVREALLRTVERVERGDGVLGEDGLAPLLSPAEREMLTVAEENALEAEQWAHVADRRADLLEDRIRSVGALVEPLLVVLVGAIVGGAVLALYLPTFRALDLL